MKFGLFLLMDNPPHRPDTELYGEIIDQALYAEELGFDAVWLTEHHFDPGYARCPSPLILATKIGALTKRIRIGIAVRVLPLDHPLLVAEEAALTDLLIGGRLDFGVGSGYSKLEFATLGIPLEERQERFQEALEIIRGAWTQESVGYAGRFYNFPPVPILPRPVQRPHPPIWVTAFSGPTAAHAARNGYQVISGATGATDNDILGQLFDAAAKGWAEGGRIPSAMERTVNHWVYLADSVADAKRDTGSAVVEFVRRNVRAFPHVSRYRPDQIDYDMLVENQFLVHGDPDTAIKVVDRMEREVGLTYLLCRTRIGGMDPAKVRRSMELLARHVMPRFKEPPAPGGTARPQAESGRH